MVSASDLAKRALVSVLRSLFSLYSVAISISRDSPDSEVPFSPSLARFRALPPSLHLPLSLPLSFVHLRCTHFCIWASVSPHYVNFFARAGAEMPQRFYSPIFGSRFCRNRCTNSENVFLSLAPILSFTHLRCSRTFLSWLQ